MPVNTTKVGAVAARGAARAGQQQANQSPFDVWTNTGKGVSENVTGILNDPVGALSDQYEGRKRQLAALGNEHQGNVSSEAAQDAFIAASEGVGDAVFKIAEAEGALATVGATFGALTALEQTLSVPFSVIPFPALPATRVLDIDIGIPHAHSHPPNFIPPAPPVPFPHTGPIISIPFISGASKVLINNMPAARCGDMGLAIWCGGYFPMFEIFFGSSSVWVEGARAARVGVDISKHCIFSTPKPSDLPIGPPIGTTITSSANVIIGGVPLPSLTSMAVGKAFGVAFKGLGKLRGMMKAADDVAEEAGEAAGKSRALGRTSVEEAIDAETGFSRSINYSDLSSGAARLVRKLKDGGRTFVGSGVHVDDLRRASMYLNRELGVAVDKSGRLVAVSGKARNVKFKRSDTVLVHTHPVNTTKIDDTGGHLRNDIEFKNQEGSTHTEAVVDWGGEVTHFDDTGIVQSPSSSPINDHGYITG